MDTSLAPSSHHEDDHQDEPINLDKVNLRLLEFISHSHAHDSLPHRSSTTSPEPCEDSEKQYYDELLVDGGRPFCQFDLVEDTIAENPKTLESWLRSTPYPENKIFETQFHDWRRFRQWQEKGRKHPDHRNAIRKILEGQTIPSYRLLDEPQQQDSITTWIEYLAYTCLRKLKAHPRDRDMLRSRTEWIFEVFPPSRKRQRVDERDHDRPQKRNRSLLSADDTEAGRSFALPRRSRRIAKQPPLYGGL
ncbi:hypothetical protein QBC40DRAFT_327306 [Triangularia verruculosa]|uniref:Uncharacterized protein n=1 Tax=Triangularia verruculosa TaxID=2587418 RepID=A0AAN7B029_9PEZI|nr:hypothetical protein QBC40DRAFT_327306 [Triangularia verruculosa]